MGRLLKVLVWKVLIVQFVFLATLNGQVNAASIGQKLNDKETSVRMKSLRVYTLLNQKAVADFFLKVLADENVDEESKVPAAWCLGMLRDKRSLRPIIHLFEEVSADYQQQKITEALNKIDPNWRKSTEAIIANRFNINTVLTDKNNYSCLSAAFALDQVNPFWRQDEKIQKNIPDLIKLVVTENPQLRIQSACKLALLQNENAFTPLCLALQDKDPDVRQLGLAFLGYSRDSRAVEPLIKSLGDSNSEVRSFAALALSFLNDKQAVEPLITTLADKDPEVRDACAYTLGKLADFRATEFLIKGLKDRNSEVRDQCADALWKMRDDYSVSLLIGALDDKDKKVQYEAAWALGLMGNTRALEPLIASLQDKDPDRRVETLISLSAIDDLRAKNAMIKTLDDNHWLVSSMAALLLGSVLGSNEYLAAFGPLVADLSSIPRQTKQRVSFGRFLFGLLDLIGTLPVAIAADIISGAPPEGELAPVIAQDIENTMSSFFGLGKGKIQNPKFICWATAIAGIEASVDSEDEQKLLDLCQDRNPETRMGSVLLLCKIQSEKSFQALMLALQDLDPSVRLSAVESLSRWPIQPPYAENIKQNLAQALADQTAEVRVTAAARLANISGQDAIPKIQEAQDKEKDPKAKQALKKILELVSQNK